MPSTFEEIATVLLRLYLSLAAPLLVLWLISSIFLVDSSLIWLVVFIAFYPYAPAPIVFREFRAFDLSKVLLPFKGCLTPVLDYLRALLALKFISFLPSFFALRGIDFNLDYSFLSVGDVILLES